MDYRKLDAKLSEALAGAGGRSGFDVFVEIAPDAAAQDLAKLVEFGVTRRGDADTVITAHLSRDAVERVAGLKAVRQVRLRRRLRPS